LQPVTDNAAMSRTAKPVFWARTKQLTGALLAVWLAVNLLVPWLARDLNAVQAFGFPLGFWLAAEGSLLVYLLIIVVYVVAMDRLEARCLRDGDSEGDDDGEAAIVSPGSGPA
jgi:putative solute:sodium symporter small subunit